jgi:CRP-like cAMP-binding protein
MADSPRQSRAEMVRAIPLFARLPDSQLQRLAENLEKMKPYAAGDIVFEKGEASDSMFIVASGSVTITNIDSASRSAITIPAGAYFGEFSLLPGCVTPTPRPKGRFAAAGSLAAV